MRLSLYGSFVIWICWTTSKLNRLYLMNFQSIFTIIPPTIYHRVLQKSPYLHLYHKGSHRIPLKPEELTASFHNTLKFYTSFYTGPSPHHIPLHLTAIPFTASFFSQSVYVRSHTSSGTSYIYLPSLCVSPMCITCVS